MNNHKEAWNPAVRVIPSHIAVSMKQTIQSYDSPPKAIPWTQLRGAPSFNGEAIHLEESHPNLAIAKDLGQDPLEHDRQCPIRQLQLQPVFSELHNPGPLELDQDQQEEPEVGELIEALTETPGGNSRALIPPLHEHSRRGKNLFSVILPPLLHLTLSGIVVKKSRSTLNSSNLDCLKSKNSARID